jgi:hypothetical protein
MTVKENKHVNGNGHAQEQEQQKPWVETPLRESYALSQAAGWYGRPLLFPPSISSSLLQFTSCYYLSAFSSLQSSSEEMLF